MTLRLNLLPWRERRRLAAIRQFRLTLIGSLALSLAGVMLIDRLAHQRLQQQAAASAMLQARNQALDVELASLEQLREARALHESQLGVLTELRVGQALVPSLLVEIETAMPQGMRLTSLDLQGQQLQIDGQAASASVLAEFMRSLQRSAGVLDLELRQLKRDGEGDAFVLMARLAASWS